MLKLRFSMLAVAMAAFASVSMTASVFAHEGHDHESMEKAEKSIAAAIAKLSPEDQKLAAAQRFCPIMTYDRLGAMGTPLKVMLEGKPVFLCCKGCIEDAQEDGAATVKTAKKLRDSSAELAKLPIEERMAIEAQKYCAINTKGFLGSMGAPIKLEVDGKPVYLCCDGCTKKALADPAGTLAKAQELIKAGTVEGHGHADHKH